MLEAEPSPSHLSAQAAELIALTEACKLGKHKVVNIYTDSNSAYSCIHVFAQQWKNRGMVTSTNKPITHTDLILHLLDAGQLRRVAVCKCTARTTGSDPISAGNRRADEEAKKAAQKPHDQAPFEVQHLDHEI